MHKKRADGTSQKENFLSVKILNRKRRTALSRHEAV